VRIIQILQEANRSLTTQEVADYGRMNWSTARKYLESLVEKGIVSKQKEEKAILWSGSGSGGPISLRGDVRVE
jgi:DNA-binding IclR family transcriptional regulator